MMLSKDDSYYYHSVLSENDLFALTLTFGNPVIFTDVLLQSD